MTACPACGAPAPKLREIVDVHVPVRTESEANKRDTWGRVKRTKEQREATTWMLRAMFPRTATAVRDALGSHLVVTLTRVAPRELDDDNLRGAVKAVRDAVADWLGLPSDRDPRVTWAYAQRRGKPREYLVRVAFAVRAA